MNENRLPVIVGKNELIETIKKGKATVADAMDACLKGIEFSKEVGETTPIGWMFKLFDIASAYKANRFQRNVIAFLSESDQLTEGQLNEFYRKLQADENFSEKFAETTFLIWEESATPLKAKVTGKLAYHLAIADIINSQYLKYSLLVHSSSIPAIESLRTYLQSNDGNPNTMQHQFNEEALLFSAGFGTRYGSGFSLSEDAKNIAKYGLGVKVKEI